MTDDLKRQRLWQLQLRYIDSLEDQLGKPIDHGIRETVAILQLLGLHTRASCEGHLDWGLPVPWVDLYVPEAVTLRAELIPLEERLEQMEDGTEEFERLCCLRNRLWWQEE